MAQVAAAVGVTGARRRLAAAYPGGTIEDEMDRRLRATMDKGAATMPSPPRARFWRKSPMR